MQSIVTLDRAAGAARRRRYPAFIRSAAAQQRAALPGGSADGRGDHRRDARRRRRADGRIRGLIVVLWRAGLRISEALALNETDLDRSRGAVLVRHGKGDNRREVGDGPLGVGAAGPMAAVRAHAAGRRAVLRAARADTRPSVGAGWRPLPAAPDRGPQAGVRRRFAPHH